MKGKKASLLIEEFVLFIKIFLHGKQDSLYMHSQRQDRWFIIKPATRRKIDFWEILRVLWLTRVSRLFKQIN